MSEFFLGVSSGNLPPTVPTQFNTQNGIATPSANILIIDGFDSSEDNDNGIITKGGAAGTGTANEVDIVLTNRKTGAVTTTNATPTTLISFTAAAVATVYQIEVRISAFNATDVAGAGYLLEGAVRTNGATTTLITPVDETISEETNMSSADIDLVVSGNTFIVQVTGIAAKTIRWNSVLTYVQVI